MTQVSLPVGFWGIADPRASSESTINCFAELAPSSGGLPTPDDTKQQNLPAYLRRAPGIASFATDNSSDAVRGMWEMGGVVYVVIGPRFYSLSVTGVLTPINTVVGGIAGGQGLVRMTDNTECLVILVPGTSTCYTYCPNNGGFQVLSNAGFTTYGALDCWFVDTFIVFLALNGRDFFNDDGQAVSGTGQITFTSAAVFPRELGTDLFVGMAVDHREVLIFGERTTEGFLNVGNPIGSPFSSAPQSYMQIGMHPDGVYTAVMQDQAIFWLANDLTIRRRSGQTPQKVSTPAIEHILATSNLTGCYAVAYSISGHLMYALTLPTEGVTIVYDAVTNNWHKMQSQATNGYWRPQVIYNAFGKQLVGDSISGSIGYLDPLTYAEFNGAPMSTQFTTQSVYNEHNRITHRRVELVATAGGSTSLTAGSQATCYVSDDAGHTFRALPMRSLGAEGDYTARAVWYNCGISRDRVYRFVISDPSPLFSVDILVELEGGIW